ncbi:MAG: BREX-1 system adenine-specific DNA-methyltransferase PglX [Nitrosomonas sp.]|nr:BREX-1 system adenine-specific DNA-methyltransferase PglX [Nitrosomonas sp.]
METTKLKKFAQFARRSLLEQVSTKLKQVLAENSAARRESAEAIKKLDEAINKMSKEQVIERVAYIWFNRFCALRFMDVNRYTRIGVVSPAEGQFQPEILAEAKMGHIDEEMVHDKTRQRIFALLDGKSLSQDPQGEAYRLLVVAACNFWSKAMPFLFQRIDDYTELLIPDDLLSGNSILAYTREAMTPDACKDVEIIGWLYQFYISEKKDEVFDGLKKNKKITPENIPAATQLFTPHWIVRYLVENSLGRLWLLNRPGSKLAEKMNYYIKPEQVGTDFLRIAKPEEIKICDPACGSGHMLTYAFDLLYAIYEEEGYEAADIPEKILAHNLYGIEIDERAGELAAFALTMKARAKQRRFFIKSIKPNICVLENVKFEEAELKEYMDFIGCDLFTAPLQSTLHQFEEADNFGSLIRPELTDVQGILQLLEAKDVSGQLFLSETHKKVLQALRQADYLSPKYHVVIANPPYMGNGGMNGILKVFLKEHYPFGKSDLMTCFMERAMELCLKFGSWGMINLPSWLFLSSFENLRQKLIQKNFIETLVHLGRGVFGSDFGSVAFTVHNCEPNAGHFGVYRRLFDNHVQVRSVEKIREAFLDQSYGKFIVDQNDFLRIPKTPIAYWLSNSLLKTFELTKLGSDIATREGMATADNNRFVRNWTEVSQANCVYGCSSEENSASSRGTWFPYNKGGQFRKWYGNNELFVEYKNAGHNIKNNVDPETGRIRSHNYNGEYAFKEGFTWSALTAGSFSARYSPKGFLFDSKGAKGFSKDPFIALALLNSVVTREYLKILSPTLDFKVGDILEIPCAKVPSKTRHHELVQECIKYSQIDWDNYETSWDFVGPPLLNPEYHQPTLKAAYLKLRTHWREMTLEMQRLEEENNRIFIDAYGLQDKLTPEVPLNEITLTCNPHYRYGNNKSEEELEALLLADTMRELVSYAVGCMFGRYALDKPGLILANQGETIEDYLKQVPEPRFPADDDNVIPMLDGDWFTDDIADRFRKFLRVALGEEHYEDNLKFIETALGKNGKPRDIRDYFLKDFYNDHVRRYKKRPIYWLFSSPKGNFNALIYMHRYRPDTVSVVLNDYLREFRTKLSAEKNRLEAISISASATQAEKTKALKDVEKLTKMIAEMEEYEREVIYPLATEQVKIDLDDGVKVNYPKFGSALKKIPGLDAGEE